MDIRIRASYDQFVILLEYMERNGDASRTFDDMRHQSLYDKRLRTDKLWIEVTELLNSCYGGVTKPLEKWKRAWADWKTKTKKKAVMIQRGASTSEDSTCRTCLTTMEERLLRVMGFPQLISEPKDESNNEINSSAEETEEHSNSQEYNMIQECTYMPLEIEVLPAPTRAPSLMVDSNLLSPIDRTEDKPKLHFVEEKPKLCRRSLTPRRGWTPYHRVLRDFTVLEMRRLRLEEMRERRLYEKEMTQLNIESQRIELDRILYEQHHSLIDTLINLLPKHTN